MLATRQDSWQTSKVKAAAGDGREISSKSAFGGTNARWQADSRTVRRGSKDMSWLDISMACGFVVLVVLIILRKRSR